MRKAILLVGLLFSGASIGAECPGPDRLEKALALVAEANPVLIVERDIYAEQTRQHAWETVVTVGYSVTDTFESGAAGPNAALRVLIPLWDRSTGLETAQARADWKRAEDSIRVAFLADVQAFCGRALQIQALDTLRAFHLDRLSYRHEQVDQGLAEPDALWGETEAAQKAEHEWRREAGRVEAQRLTLARRYGGDEFGRLRVLLESMTQRFWKHDIQRRVARSREENRKRACGVAGDE